jgi:hypothetical protein
VKEGRLADTWPSHDDKKRGWRLCSRWPLLKNMRECVLSVAWSDLRDRRPEYRQWIDNSRVQLPAVFHCVLACAIALAHKVRIVNGDIQQDLPECGVRNCIEIVAVAGI